MADITITPTAVIAGANASIGHGTAGAAITAGQLLYKSSATNRHVLADADGVTAEARHPTGLALHGAATGQPIAYAKPGSDVTIGATLTPGEAYYLSSTPGGLCLKADVGTGEESVFVGMAESAAVLAFDPKASGVVL